MPVKYRYPEWEREDNRTKIFSTIFDKSMTFMELKNHTGFAKSTLSSHLKELQELGIIEKALVNDRVVYQTSLNEEALEAINRILDIDPDNESAKQTKSIILKQIQEKEKSDSLSDPVGLE